MVSDFFITINCLTSGIDPCVSVKMSKSRLYDSATQVETVGHDCGTEDATAEINSLVFDNGRRRQITPEYLANRSIFNKRKLDTKTNHNSEDKRHDKKFKSSQTPHGTVRIVEQENDEDIDQCESTSCD